MEELKRICNERNITDYFYFSSATKLLCEFKSDVVIKVGKKSPECKYLVKEFPKDGLFLVAESKYVSSHISYKPAQLIEKWRNRVGPICIIPHNKMFRNGERMPALLMSSDGLNYFLREICEPEMGFAEIKMLPEYSDEIICSVWLTDVGCFEECSYRISDNEAAIVIVHDGEHFLRIIEFYKGKQESSREIKEQRVELQAIFPDNQGLDIQGINQLQEDRLIKLYELISADPQDSFIAKPVVNGSTHTEGRKILRYTSTYERNPRCRQAAISRCQAKFGRVICEACQKGLENLYSEYGADCIDVHHLLPLSMKDGENTAIDVEKDLVCLCPNCHRIIHRMIRYLNRMVCVDELKAIVVK